MRWEIGHSFCDLWIMPDILKIAAKSELRFLPKSRIHGFYHSPRSHEVEEELSKYLMLHNVPCIASTFTVKGGFYSRYGEKIHVSEINCPNVALLDSDVLMVHDMDCIWDLDFDVAVIHNSPYMESMFKEQTFVNQWNEMFTKYGKRINSPYVNAGIVFAKNNILREIRDEWIYLLDEDLPKLTHGYCKEEYVLSLCLADKNVLHLSKDIVKDFPLRESPFPTSIFEFEKESTPLMWHIGYYGLNVEF